MFMHTIIERVIEKVLVFFPLCMNHRFCIKMDVYMLYLKTGTAKFYSLRVNFSRWAHWYHFRINALF